MAKTVNVIVTDDIDGSPGAEVVSFSFKGQSYDIDLSPLNQRRMHESLQPFIEAGRLMGRPASRRPAPKRTDYSAIRAWAAGQGLHVSERGRLSADIVSKYDAAH